MIGQCFPVSAVTGGFQYYFTGLQLASCMYFLGQKDALGSLKKVPESSLKLVRNFTGVSLIYLRS